MKKSTKSFLFITAAALAGMHAYNRFVANVSTKKNMLPTKNGSYYTWTQGNIFYTKLGTGKPILLVHDINSASSSVEWSKITKRLQKNHTVYTIDLLGCGLSDKPPINYTTYMYVQLITAFIKDVIGEKTDVIATNLSAPAVIMSNHMDQSIVDNMILINPVPLQAMKLVPDKLSKLKLTILKLPIIGTFIYNILWNPARLSRIFRSLFFSNEQFIPPQLEDTYYEAAHMDNSSGKHLYASILGNYMSGDISHAIQQIDKPIYIISSRSLSDRMNTIEGYRKLNKQFEVTSLSNCKLFPQLENPEKTTQIIESILTK